MAWPPWPALPSQGAGAVPAAQDLAMAPAGRIAQAQAGAGAGGARPQAAFKAAGRGMLSDESEIEACLVKS